MSINNLWVSFATIDWPSIKCQSRCWLNVNLMLTNYWSRCWLRSCQWSVDWRYRSRLDHRCLYYCTHDPNSLSIDHLYLFWFMTRIIILHCLWKKKKFTVEDWNFQLRWVTILPSEFQFVDPFLLFWSMRCHLCYEYMDILWNLMSQQINNMFVL